MQEDPAARMAQLAKAEADVMKDYPVMPIYFTTARRLVSSRVHGWHQAKAGNMQSRWLSLDAGKATKRSDEHTSELQSLMRNSYAVFCLKKKKQKKSHAQ